MYHTIWHWFRCFPAVASTPATTRNRLERMRMMWVLAKNDDETPSRLGVWELWLRIINTPRAPESDTHQKALKPKVFSRLLYPHELETKKASREWAPHFNFVLIIVTFFRALLTH